MPSIDLHLSQWAAISQIALALIAFGALIGAIAQIRAARSGSRVAITYNYTERFSAITSQHLTAAYNLFDLGSETADEKFTAFLQWDPPKQLDALMIPNLIEEIAGMYNHKLLHKEITADFFGVLAQDMWELGAWFIERYRTHANDLNFYSQWELMLVDLGRAPDAGMQT